MDVFRSANDQVARAAIILLGLISAGGIRGQNPVHKVFPPTVAERKEAGPGKFIIFTREETGEWKFVAGAWECIPALPERPVTKRVEFGPSSCNATPLLDTLVADEPV